MQKEVKKKLPIWVWLILGFFLAIVLIIVLAIIFGSNSNGDYGENSIELGTTYYLSSIMSGVYNQYSDLDLYLLTYNVTNNGNKPVSVTFVSEIQDYTSQSKDTLVLQPDESKIYSQHPFLKPTVQIDEITNANLYFKIAAGNTTLDEETIPIKLYSKDTMIWGFVEDNVFVDTSYLIGAWVTPHVKEIDQLIRISAEYHPDRTITGYQCSDCETESDWQTYTDLQVQAIYNALQQEYYIVYINTPIAYSSNQEASQRVKLPKESIELASANCIDGTVLFASALESAGINPKIILIPGHAFVCWDLSPDLNVVDCLETTMIQNYDFIDAENEGLEEYSEELDSGNFESGVSQYISINALREYGIVPMS
jgi:hypothetical protein